MNSHKNFSFAVYIIIFLIGIILNIGSGGGGGGDDTGEATIIGSWEVYSIDGEVVAGLDAGVTFTSETFSFYSPDCSRSGDYVTSGNSMTLTVDAVTGDCGNNVGDVDTLEFSITSSELTLDWENGGVLVYRK